MGGEWIRMKQVQRILVIFACLVILTIPALVQASPFSVENGKVYGHREPDGKIVLLAKAIGGNWSFSVNKIFTAGGKSHYFISAELEDQKVKKNHLTGVVLTIDGKSVPLQLINNTQSITDETTYHGYYLVSEELLSRMANAQDMHIAFDFDGASPENGTVKATTVAAFKRLFLMNQERYVREGRVLGLKEDPNKAFLHPELFIPNAKPEDVMNALIYETNFNDYNGKEEFNYSEGYYIYHTSDPQVVQLVCRDNFAGSTDTVTVDCRPYNNGVWVTLSLMLEYYTGGSYGYGGVYFPGTVYENFYEDAYSDDLFSDASGYWRMNAQLWADRLQAVYRDLYGEEDYGFTCKTENVKRGPFTVATVDVKKFPELTGVKAGDLLTAIDGVPTALMGATDLEYWLQNGEIGTPRTLSFKTLSGEEKKIVLLPQVRLTPPETRKDYKTILMEKMPKWFVKKDRIKLPLHSSYLDYDYYDPLAGESSGQQNMSDGVHPAGH
jgi:hypothetical protein